MFKQIVQGVALKDSIDRCADALEKIATALWQHLPPVTAEEMPKLEANDYQPATDRGSYEQEVFKLIELKEGPMDAEKEARVRAFIRSQYNL